MAKQTGFKWVPVIFGGRCTGCGLCVEACGPRCLKMENDIAVLFDPDRCGSEEHCISVCKDGAIQMAWIPTEGDPNIGKWRAHTENQK